MEQIYLVVSGETHEGYGVVSAHNTHYAARIAMIDCVEEMNSKYGYKFVEAGYNRFDDSCDYYKIVAVTIT